MSGESTMEREFMADLVLPDGRTVGEWAVPQPKRVQKSERSG